MLEDRRNSENPGTEGRGASMFTPGCCSIARSLRTVMNAGASVSTCSATVIEVRTGSGFGVSSAVLCAGNWADKHVRSNHTVAVPTGLDQDFGTRTECNLQCSVMCN